MTKVIDYDAKQDVIAWLEEYREGCESRSRDTNAHFAARALTLIEQYDSREATALGMLMAQRPHAEIRDFLLQWPA